MSAHFQDDFTAIDSSFCRFGAESLVRLLQSIEAQMDGVEKSEDIEYVHKMRVASRRIRAALPLFKECFPQKHYKKWLSEIKKVTQFLGMARDLDVQILVLRNYVENLLPTEPKIGMQALLERHINQRGNIQLNVISGLQELEKSTALQQTTDYCQRIIQSTANISFNLYEVQEKAFWQISSKLDEFLAMEAYVHNENEILKHHEMRIKAKWLRYTMETFAPLYPGELKDEIEMMKNFQDSLGEMHDCDVWIDQIPKFIEETQKGTLASPKDENDTVTSNQDLLKFLDYIKEKRKANYAKFVSYWEEKKSENSFEELRKKTSAGFTASGFRAKAELANPYVKIGIIADIHANLNALEAVIQDAEQRGITVFLNAGDIIGFGGFPNEAIQTLYCKKTLSVIGNYDLEVIENGKKGKGPKRFSLEFTRKALTKSNEIYLRSLPFKLDVEIGQKKCLLVHGTPDSVDEHLCSDTSEERFQEIAKSTGAEVIVSGHLHEQFTKKVDGTLFINPGSVGKPSDGNPQAAYAVIEANPFSVELIRVNYDVAATAETLRSIGAPESYPQMLLRGVSLENIVAEDKNREKDMEKRSAKITRYTRTISKKYWPDVEHSEQVRKLSLGIFDELQKLHKFSKRERCWLECAAILHDIGLLNGPKRHQKSTLKLILNETQLLFTSVERQVIANIARYHRKRCPRKEDYSFASLNSSLKRKVRILAGILRLADALDFSHRSIVSKVTAHAGRKYVTIEGIVRFSPILEEYALNQKKDMFEQSLKKKVVIRWKQKQIHEQIASIKTDSAFEIDKRITPTNIQS